MADSKRINQQYLMDSNGKFTTVDEYLETFDGTTRAYLDQMRSIVRGAAPKAVEDISYNMPCVKINSVVVWYAGYKQHIGLYPKTNALVKLKKELSAYKTSKGAIQFPLDAPLPTALIKKIVKLRVTEDKEEAAAKAMKAASKKLAAKRAKARKA